MFKLRFWIGVLVWWLVVLFNVERANEPINIASFVYILVPIAATIPMAFPRLVKQSLVLWAIVPSLVAYFVLKVALGYELFNGGLPLTVLEISILLISILLVKQLAGVVLDFEETVAKLTFRQLGLPPRLYESVDAEDLYREVKRCRRFQHPLTLLLIEPKLNGNGHSFTKLIEELQKTMAKRFLHSELAMMLSDNLRDTDIIAQYGESFAVVLPETTPEHAKEMIKIVKERAREVFDLDLRVGMAAFPESATTLGGLLDTAQKGMSQPTGMLGRLAGESHMPPPSVAPAGDQASNMSA